MAESRCRIVAAAVCAAALSIADDARAAGTAFAVETAEVSAVGSCKVEQWFSAASNRDRIGVVTPSCVADFFRPVELSVQVNRARAEVDWTTSLTPKAKTNVVPTAIGSWGWAFAASAAYDAATGENTALFAVVPGTLRLSENWRININPGFLWDRASDRRYFSYGVGVDWRFTEIWTLTGEVFGLAGSADTPTVTRPRFQAGLRYRPVERFSMDFIYGRNITGENANWLTVGMTIRFPPPEQ
jgi:hypothetical protein